MLPARAYAEQTPSPERLVKAHMDLVRRIAWHMHGRTGRRVEIEDLLQAGYLGLVDASQRYEPRAGVNFAAYAAIRIRGSIVDLLRENARLNRAAITMQQRITGATLRLEHELMRSPTNAEVAEAAGITLADYEAWQSEFAAGRVSSIDEVYSDSSALFTDTARTPEDRVQERQMRELLRRALAKLPEREALVLQLYFVEELNVYEIAEIMGVTTGRVSQIKKAATTRLREMIAAMEEGREA